MTKKQRLNHCYGPGCTTGYPRVQQSRKLSLFKVPKDADRRLLWERNLHRLDRPLDADCAVCELHFEPHFILRDYVHIINGVEVRIPRGTPTLAPDAVPTILPNLTSKHQAH
uniref:THAP domain containing protein n=1 Tax=Rhipicephalus zambeziensis TaxID=60191 RepID=A0A224Z0P5_9ACAR